MTPYFAGRFHIGIEQSGETGLTRLSGRTRSKQHEKSAAAKEESPSILIDAKIKQLADCRGKTLSHVHALIMRADPAVEECRHSQSTHNQRGPGE